MNVEREETFRAAVSSYLVLGGLFGGVFAFTIYATIFTHPSFWKAAVTFGAAIAHDELRLRSLFGGVHGIKSDEIRKIRLGFNLNSNGGPLRLFVERKDNSVSSINAKVFSREAVRAVLDFGKRVAVTDSGGLEDGLVAKIIRKRRRPRRDLS